MIGIITPELCQPYIQRQPEEPSLFLIPAKPTIISTPTGAMEQNESGFLCRFNQWVNENPILAIAGLIGSAAAASYFLLRTKQ